MWQATTLTDGSRLEVGLGWFTSPWNGHPSVSHGGGTAGFSCEYRRFLDSLPAGNSGYTLFYRGLAEFYLNDFANAQAHFDRAYELDKTTLPAPIGQALSYSLKHRPADGLKSLNETLKQFNTLGVSDPEMLYKIAQAFAVLGDSKSAIRVLQQSSDGGFFCAPYLAKDPLMNSLRNDPKFKQVQSEIEARHQQFKQHFNLNRPIP